MLPENASLAMAGMAEGAEQFAFVVAWGGLLVASVGALAAIARRSWIAASVSAIAVAAVTALFMPWNAFAPMRAADLSDSDAAYWVSAWRVMASAWMGVVLLVLAAAVVVKVRRSRHGIA